MQNFAIRRIKFINNSPVCEPTPLAMPKIVAENEDSIFSPMKVPSPEITTGNPSPLKQTSDSGSTIPPDNHFDLETLLDRQTQSKAFIHILGLCRLIKKDEHKKFAQPLESEGFIKED